MNVRNSHAAAVAKAKTIGSRGDWTDLSQVCATLLAFRESTLVRQLIQRAPLHDRTVLPQASVLAQYLWLSEDAQGAVTLANDALRVIQPTARLLFARGMALQSLGQLNAAAADFQQAIELDPMFTPPHLALANSGIAPDGESRLGLLRNVLRNTKNPEDAADILFALYRENERLGDEASAWKALDAGNSVLQRVVGVNGDAQRAAFQRLHQRLESHADVLPASTHTLAPVFIVGMPRSGTTVVERILSRSPQLFSAGELRDFELSVSYQADHAYAALDDIDGLLGLPPVLPQAVAETFAGRMANLVPTGRRLLDKWPGNLFNADLILEAFPRAKVICTLKSPMDAGFSNYRQRFGGNTHVYSYDLQAIAEHYALHLEWIKALQYTYPQDFMLMPYEELVGDPSGSALKLAQFVGVQLPADADRIAENPLPVATASTAQVQEAVHDRFVGQWQRYAEQLAPLEAAFGRLGVAATVPGASG